MRGPQLRTAYGLKGIMLVVEANLAAQLLRPRVPLLQHLQRRPQRRPQPLARAAECDGDDGPEWVGETVEDHAKLVVAQPEQEAAAAGIFVKRRGKVVDQWQKMRRHSAMPHFIEELDKRALGAQALVSLGEPTAARGASRVRRARRHRRQTRACTIPCVLVCTLRRDECIPTWALLTL